MTPILPRLAAPPSFPPTPVASAAAEKPADARLRAIATRLEATFLAEMLKHAGLGQTRGANGGGIGEDQFASFFADAQAQAMAARGGIGLVETLYNSLKENAHDTEHS